MMSVATCIALNHDLRLVLLAAIVCIVGVAVSIKLYQRTIGIDGPQMFGWVFLTAVSAGASIWSTHFIAMLGFQPDVPVTFDPVMTIASLLVAIVGTSIGLAISVVRRIRIAPVVGGAFVGLAIAAMHFIGMSAYRVDGLIVWNGSTICLALMSVIILSAAAFDIARRKFAGGGLIATGVLCAGILALHFIAMTAFVIIPLDASGGRIDTAAFAAMALAIAIAGLIIAGSGLTAYLIDSLNRSLSDENIRFLALHDQLTGLPNRLSYRHFVDIQLTNAITPQSNFAVIGINLTRFKDVNDNWGHAIGDLALQAIAKRLQTLARNNRYFARLGGDEFAAVKSFASEEDLHLFLTSVEATIKQPMQIEGIDIALECSIGVAVFPHDGTTREILIKNADLAVNYAKADAAQKIYYYDQKLGDQVRLNRSLIDDLRIALKTGALTLHYQPQVSFVAGSIMSYEALLRWTHPTMGPISPAVFIPLAEESRLILEIGEWVLRRACADAASWDLDHHVAVNVSAVQVNQQDLPALVHQVLLETGLAPHRLELELTETALVRDKSQSLNVIRRIKALGVNIALDDFGVGYSSFETLRLFPFDKIKLDRSFIESLAREPQSLAIVRAVLAIGRSLDIAILAEGIETSEQWSILAIEGCNEGQGFGLGRPVPNELVVRTEAARMVSSQMTILNDPQDRDQDSGQLNASHQIRRLQLAAPAA